MSTIRNLRLFLAQPPVREFLAWCLPALLLGLALRSVLAWQLPYGIYHVDSPDFLTTPDSLLYFNKFELHSKKTFLVPMLFTIPFLLHVPALIVIPLAQHLLGLGSIVLVGLLCRFWFHWWKAFILPLTLIAALDPYLLWYERTLMAETTFLFCTLLLTLAGTLYTLRPSLRRFVFLCLTLFLEAGARPEGKLLFGFGLFLLVLLHFRQRRVLAPRLAIMLVLAVGTHFLTHTSQAGLLLYTSVARLTPSDLKCAPGFDPYIASIRTDLQGRWGAVPAFPKVRDRRLVSDAVKKYLEAHPNRGSDDPHEHDGVNAFCLKLAMETCRRNLPALPNLIYHKFRFTATDNPSGLFDNYALFDRQHEAYNEAIPRSSRLSVGLAGRKMTTSAEFLDFTDHHFGELPWFNRLVSWQNHSVLFSWQGLLNYFRFPDQGFYYGIPYYFVVAAIGVAFSIFRRGTLQPLYLAWGVTLFGLFFTIILTANTKPRFRFVFEPFWFIYLALLLDSALLAWQTLICRVTEPAAPEHIEAATP